MRKFSVLQLSKNANNYLMGLWCRVSEIMNRNHSMRVWDIEESKHQINVISNCKSNSNKENRFIYRAGLSSNLRSTTLQLYNLGQFFFFNLSKPQLFHLQNLDIYGTYLKAFLRRLSGIIDLKNLEQCMLFGVYSVNIYYYRCHYH